MTHIDTYDHDIYWLHNTIFIRINMTYIYVHSRIVGHRWAETIVIIRSRY
jgi:hypothetical protein